MTDLSDETLLEQLLTGARSADDPEMARRLAADDQLAARFARLQRLAGQLDEVGSAVRQEAPQLEREVVQTARRHFGLGRSRGGPTRWQLALLAVAAALVASVLLWRAVAPGGTSLVDNPNGEDLYLGPGGPAAMRVERDPTGACTFVWELGAGEAQYAELRFYVDDDAAATEVRPMLVVEDAQQWVPTAAEREALPPEFVWEVKVFDPSGRPLGSQQLPVRLP
ncbi:MAG: hypothetical protein AAF628_32705 [Planctomycetota bacterium]